MNATDFTDIASLPGSSAPGNHIPNHAQPMASRHPSQQPPNSGELPPHLQPTYFGKKEQTYDAPVYSLDEFNVHSHPYYGKATGAVQEYPAITKDQPLPPRDIPTHDKLQGRQLDPAVQPGYIPPIHPGARISDEYIRQRAITTDREMREYQARKYRDAQIGQLIDAVQVPALLALLFFIFNTHYSNHWIYQTTASFGGHDDLGNINTLGLCVKSLIFGACYYLGNRLVEFMLIT